MTLSPNKPQKPEEGALDVLGEDCGGVGSRSGGRQRLVNTALREESEGLYVPAFPCENPRKQRKALVSWAWTSYPNLVFPWDTEDNETKPESFAHPFGQRDRWLWLAGHQEERGTVPQREIAATKRGTWVLRRWEPWGLIQGHRGNWE